LNKANRIANARDFGNLLSLALMEGDRAFEQARVVTAVDHPSDETKPSQAITIQRSGAFLARFEPPGGVVPLGSAFYVERETDADFYDAISRRDAIVLLKGARQIGKTSLLARGLQNASDAGSKVVAIDFQALDDQQLQSTATHFRSLAESNAEQLDLGASALDGWNDRRAPGINLKDFVKDVVLGEEGSVLVWALDEVDRLFSYPYSSEVFGMFRGWYNARAFDRRSAFHRLTLAISYATEAQLFIRDPNQSPFNVGTRLALADFTLAEIGDLNGRYGSPLESADDLIRYMKLVGGHPYLARVGLHYMASRGVGVAAFEDVAENENGPLSDHLHHLLFTISKDPGLVVMVRKLLDPKQPSGKTSDLESFFFLRSLGVVSGESAREMKLRCQIYANYLAANLPD
jgi:hypothetical protein